MAEILRNRVEIIKELLQTIDDNPDRPGLEDTPSRVNLAFHELFSGYNKDPLNVFKIFDPEQNLGPGQLVLLKNIEFSSFCEHHMMPFIGIAHIAYIPNKRVLGASKLARLLDIYTKRLQIQERIGEQVTDNLMKYLTPQGAACILKAKHFCISGRGVMKQNSEYITASLKGCLLDQDSARAELYSMINI